uniref:Ionotropic glutamate receptor L-glutamate and glycine-binding domain-containing protein n=1 Tax=Anopheles epiroticus TaxID=199890 RepID=A0A182PHP8_9DIPT
MVQFDWALFLLRCGFLTASPSADAALDSLAYLTTHPGPLERPAAGQELCISPPSERDPYWSDVLERYLHQFPLLPRVLTRTKLGDVPLHSCSLYLLFEPYSQARQVFLRIQFLSSNGNWNAAARFAVMINSRSSTREIFNQFENFDLMGVQHGLVLMSVPEHNRTFTLMADCPQKTMDYVMEVDDMPEFLANRSAQGLRGQSIVIPRRAEFPFLFPDGLKIDGVYYKFFTAFARKYKGRVVFQNHKVLIVLTIHNRETLVKPYAIGSFTGNCLLVPEKPKEGLIHFLLSPFSSPVWYLCCCFVAATFLLNWRCSLTFQNNILLTVLFGDQAAETRYTLPERRLIFIAVVILFFFSESYSAKLLSTFIESLNQPRIRTIQALAASDIPIGVLHFEQVEAYEQLHHNLLVLDEPDYDRNMREGRNAFLLQCGNAENFLHREMRDQPGKFRVPYYILDEFLGWQMNGFSVSKFAPVAVELVEFIGLIGQAGLWEYWREQYIQRLRNIARRELSQRETLELRDLISLQYVLTSHHGKATMRVKVFLYLLAILVEPSRAPTTAVKSLIHITTGMDKIETPSARYELCLLVHTTDFYWNSVVDMYLQHFSNYPRVFLNSLTPHMQLHRCSIYLIVAPNIEGAQLFSFLQLVSFARNWNQAANFIIAINDRPTLASLVNIFRAFPPLGVRNVAVLRRHRQQTVDTLVSDYRSDRIFVTESSPEHRFLLTQDRNRNLQRNPVNIKTIMQFPFLLATKEGIVGVYRWFFVAFANHVNAVALFVRERNTTRYEIALHIYPNVSSLKPVSFGSFSGDCMVIPEVSRKGLFYFLLIPFSLPVWILCCLLVVLAFLLNWRLSQHFPNALLPTILFGDQVSLLRYTVTERRLLTVGSVLLFVFTESYWAKLHSLFMMSLNEPQLRTIEQFLQTDIPLEVVHRDASFYYQDLHGRRELTVSKKDDMLDNVRSGRCALLLPCSNAQLLLHMLLNVKPDVYRVPYYILEQHVQSHLDGFSVFQYSPIADQLLHFVGNVQQAGLPIFWRSFYLVQLERITKSRFVTQETLHWAEIASLMYVLLLGHTLATMVFVLEVMSRKIRYLSVLFM